MRTKYWRHLACLAVLALSTPCGAVIDGSLLLGHVFVEESLLAEAANEFSRQMEVASEGQASVSVFPESTLCSLEESPAKLINGDIDFALVPTAALIPEIPELELFEAPYLFTDSNEAMQMLNFSDGFHELSMRFSERGMVLLGFLSAGYRQLISSRLIPSSDVRSLQGTKVRVEDDPVHHRLFEALGMIPVNVPFGEIKVAISSRKIDAVEAPFSTALADRFYMLLSFAARTDHMHEVVALVMSQRRYNTLSEQEREWMHEAARGTVYWEWPRSVELNERARGELERRGLNLVNIDVEGLRALTADMRDELMVRFADLYAKMSAY